MIPVLFLTDPDDALPREFAAEGAAYDLTPCCAALAGLRSECEWCIAWAHDGTGLVQAWLENIHAGPEHSFFLGTDPSEAMRRAVQIIATWELPTGKPN